MIANIGIITLFLMKFVRYVISAMMIIDMNIKGNLISDTSS